MASAVRKYVPEDVVVFVAQTGSPLLANECIKYGICLFPDAEKSPIVSYFHEFT